MERVGPFGARGSLPASPYAGRGAFAWSPAARPRPRPSPADESRVFAAQASVNGEKLDTSLADEKLIHPQ